MTTVFTAPAPLQTAVLFLVFNRPDTTAQVFEAIRQARPPRLYVAADGPRANREGEAERVARVREIATDVDWPCEVKTQFREENLGCKSAVSGGITWFFEHEEQGIILEDDCLPHFDFFRFCEQLLSRYASEERVWVITGDNFQNGIQRGEGSYYFSRFNHVWGWASWRRAWEKADMSIDFWPDWKRNVAWKNFWTDVVAQRYWTRIFNRAYRNEIDTWDYQWTACIWFYGGLTATPNVNLIKNIGFGDDATHTNLLNQNQIELQEGFMSSIVHPNEIKLDTEADTYVFDNHFGGKELRFPYSLTNLPRRLLKFISRKTKIIYRRLVNYNL